MSRSRRCLQKVTLVCLTGLLASCAAPPPEAPIDEGARLTAKEETLPIGGQPVVTLAQPQTPDPRQPQILSAEIIPGRGMNIYQVRGYVPSQGIINLFASPPLEEAARRFNGGPEDFNGNEGFRIGGGILVPFANRIRGKFLPEERAIETQVAGKTVKLTANWKGKEAHAEWHAMHGLILDRAMDKVSLDSTSEYASVKGELDAKDFGGRWLSKTQLTVTATLKKNKTFGFTVEAKNTGSEPLPMGIGWHPYFLLPSGDRRQVRLQVPARKRALVDNYDNVFPTGKLETIADTAYDFSIAGGRPLGDLFLDDCFVDLARDSQGRSVAEIIDPAAEYGIRIVSLSPDISAYQVYAPPEKNFVALEPQFNWADPYSPAWGTQVNTGMVTLQPGQSITYSVELELFVP
ncbi:MAG: aldose 1-epimerase [Acidobacteriota bacterium]